MTVSTAVYEARLTAVQAAILSAINGQSYSIGGRSFSRQNLSELARMEQDLINLINNNANGGRRGVVGVTVIQS